MESRFAEATERIAQLETRPEGGVSEEASDDERLDEANERIAELEAQLEDLRSEGGADWESERERLVGAVEALRGRVDQAEQEAEDARRRLASAGSREPQPSDDRLAHRRERLRAYREALRGREEKVRKGGDALRSRFEAAERLLAQREELVAVRHALDEAQCEIEERRVRSRVFVNLFCVVMIVATLGALSWVGAKQMVPGMYAASMTVAADDHGRLATNEELAGWTRFHTELLKDPRFLEVAAERMKRRGITTLATAPELETMLAESFDYDDSTPGELKLELRGRGATRTQRILETLGTALVSQANAARRVRTDAMVTKIAENAKPTAGAIENEHLIVAGSIFGGSILAVGLLGGLLWRHMSASKVKFEQQDQIDLILEEARWGDATTRGGIDRRAA